MQPALFPLPIEVQFCDPANLGADCGLICRGEDGCDYVVKDGKTGGSVPATPHSEWFCTLLAQAIGIASAPCAILNMLDGTTAFGSRWEGGVLNQSTAAGYWWEKVKSGEIPLDNIRGTLSRIYAFDNFVFNPDRHCGNFIVREQRNGFAVLANDYSRAWLCNGMPPPALPMTGNNTINSQRWLTQFWNMKYVQPSEANIALDKIRSVEVTSIERILEGHPQDWLTEKERDNIFKWWGTKEMFSRLDGISKGVADGSYL
jgi:hypothetical protein